MDIKTFLGIAHIIGVAIAVGGATISDIFFLRILKSQKVSKEDYANLEVLSRVVWAGIIILIMSGLSFLWRMYATTGTIGALQSDKFLVKLTIVAIVTINGLVFKFLVFPKIRGTVGKKGALMTYVNWFAITGAISIVSWYTIVIYSVIRGVTLSYGLWLGMYLAAVVVSAQVARIVITYLLKVKDIR